MSFKTKFLSVAGLIGIIGKIGSNPLVIKEVISLIASLIKSKKK